jgi:protein SCO1/2
MKILQENDRYNASRIVLLLAGSVAVMVASGFVSQALVRAPDEPARAESGNVFTGLMSTEHEGERRRVRGEERLESWGWVSSASVHMPIERAMELSVPRLLVDRPESIGVDEHLGTSVPLEARFEDTAGRRVRLGDFADGKLPVLLVLAYSRCPMLCGLVEHGAAKAVKELGWRPGERFRALTVSFDPDESAADARSKQDALLEAIGERGKPEVWRFLRGHEAEIDALTGAAGFKYYRDPASGELAHVAVVLVLTPEGRISRYLYGIDFRAKDLELALLEASEGKSGSALERIILRCYRWDGTTHRYELAVLEVMRATGAMVGVLVLGLVGSLWRKERRA